jgi:DNA replication and repair protein RecF
MYLQNLRLFNFKNYSEIEVSFSEKLNVFTGANGAGKTNLLDAIHYLSSGRSALNSIDSQNIREEESFFNVTGTFLKSDKKYNVSCQLQKGQKKSIFINKKKIEKISEFIGNFPVVLITPDDNEIIKEGSEIRRNLFDNIFSQLNKRYLEVLIDYTKALKSRNALLKLFYENRTFDKDLLDPYNNVLSEKGEQIYILRKEYFEKFLPFFSYYFKMISGEREEVSLLYKSSLEEGSLLQQLKEKLPDDRLLQRTTAGIHKDDFIFTIKGQPLRKFGSQGQQKSYLVALKLAHYAIIQNLKGIKSILLLDDIFDKLDESRIEQLINIILEPEFGQVFITDARPTFSEAYFQKANCIKSYFVLNSSGINSCQIQEINLK